MTKRFNLFYYIIFIQILLLDACIVKQDASTQNSLSTQLDPLDPNIDNDGDGQSSSVGDCDDRDPNIYFGAVEICEDGIDQNCDGEDLQCDETDEDHDGFSMSQGDCDDQRFDVNPNAIERCGDGVDQNCDGEDLNCDERDEDRDGYSVQTGDCNDNDPLISPTSPERCGDGIDQDCNGRDLSCDELDEDGDGYSVATGDCDDTDARSYPGARERCSDGKDQDCDGTDLSCDIADRDEDGIADEIDLCPDTPDLYISDIDGDGVGDGCDNCPRTPNPQQTDLDQSGIGDTCEDVQDADQDGVSVADGDCDDMNASRNPNATEICDGIDNDCDDFIDNGCSSDLRSPTVMISAGTSLLGSQEADETICRRDPDSDENCDEVPQLDVQLRAFSVEIHEVTQQQYQACMNAQRCTPPLRAEGVPLSLRFGNPEFAQHPVTFVSQVQAEMYCGWLGARLPSEAEWERVARGPNPQSRSQRFTNTDGQPSCEQANIAGCFEGLTPVSQVEGDRSPEGVYGLTGNAHELVAGWYHPDAYRQLDATNPQPITMRGDRDQVPVRGGSYQSNTTFSSLSYRGFRLLMRRGGAQPDVGFRCVYDR